MGLEVVRTVMDRFPDPSRPNREIIQLLRICLNNNDTYRYRGQPWEWEQETLAKCKFKPSFYLRF